MAESMRVFLSQWAFDAFTDARTAVAPASMQSFIHSGGVFWTWTFTEAQ